MLELEFDAVHSLYMVTPPSYPYSRVQLPLLFPNPR